MFGGLAAGVDAARAAGDAVARDSDKLDSGWPPVLVFAVLVVAVAAVTAVVIMMRRARAVLRGDGKKAR